MNIDDFAMAFAEKLDPATVASTGGVQALRDLCNDPRDLFVLSPQPLRVSDVVKMYASDQSETIRLFSELRVRCASERWVEQRAVYQSRRFSAKQESIIQAEAFVIASLACDMHMQLLRSRIERWGFLSEIVEQGLIACVENRRAFTQDLRDASRALDELENIILGMLPELGTTEAASRLLTGSKTKRDELIGEIETKLKSMASADRGGKVLQLVRDAG